MTTERIEEPTNEEPQTEPESNREQSVNPVQIILIEIKNELSRINDKIDHNTALLHHKIDANTAQLDQKIDNSVSELHRKIDANTAHLDQKINSQTELFEARFDAVNKRIDDIQPKLLNTENQQHQLNRILIGGFIALIIAIIGAQFLPAL